LIAVETGAVTLLCDAMRLPASVASHRMQALRQQPDSNQIAIR